MKRFLIIPNVQKDPAQEVSSSVCAYLEARGAFARVLPEGKTLDAAVSEADAPFDALVVIGGDGSVLDAAVGAMKHGLPLCGVNLGRLGYLAEVEAADLSPLSRLVDGSCLETKRITLRLEVLHKNGEVEVCERPAVNEVFVSHGTSFGIADMTLTHTNGTTIRYRGDGILVATPSGSTAYSFSAGGPMLDPNLDAFCVTPVCPHTFFNRPMVLGGENTVEITNTSAKGEVLLASVDGRNRYEVAVGDSVRIKRREDVLRLLSFGALSTMTTLRQKMDLAEAKD